MNFTASEMTYAVLNSTYSLLTLSVPSISHVTCLRVQKGQ